MGLFDRFKKKEEPQPIQNKMNSVFTMKFIVPFFQIFDKTNPKLAHFPIRMAVGGSVQYRIADPDLCFNNVCLSQMTPEQLEEHVKDGLTAVVKTYLNSITTIPVLQFESAIMKINDAAKNYISPIFIEEYGINLRTIHLSRFTYDIEDPNYVQLHELSRQAARHMAEDQDLEHALELEKRRVAHSIDIDNQKTAHQLEVESQKSAHSINLNRDRLTIDSDNKNHQRIDIELQREKNAIEHEKNELEHELRAKRQHLDADIYERRKAVDVAAENGTISIKKGDGLTLDLDTDDFKLDGL